jgi:hypothetical protein
MPGKCFKIYVDFIQISSFSSQLPLHILKVKVKVNFSSPTGGAKVRINLVVLNHGARGR